MYISPLFQEDEDRAAVRAFLQQNSFGVLISSVERRYWGTHLPFLCETDAEGRDWLLTHLSIENQQWRHFQPDEEVLVIFQGAHAYVSSSWYAHENVPTWNYIAVHVYGRVQRQSETELHETLRRLVDHYEAGRPNAVRVDALSEATMRQMRGIVGLKIEIREVQSSHKLSQNRNDSDYRTIVRELEAAGEQATADAMRRKRPHLF